jgi:peptidoglycan/xylan/chitin deacetylase (PgdA/CDA1 family)
VLGIARSLAVAGVLIVAVAGCRSPSPARSAAASRPATATATPAPSPAPVESAAIPDGVIGVVAPPGAPTAGGAELGPAVAVSPARIQALAQPSGPGAVPRGTVPAMIFHGPRNAKRIALTFDSNMTDSMLRKIAAGTTGTYANSRVVDELQQLKVPATFFLAGKWMEAYPQLTRRIAADPSFELASHSWAHEGFRAPCYGLGTIPRGDMAADVERSFEILRRFTPHPTRYFRFPGGCYDAAALRAIAPTGCTAVEYDDVSGDAFGTSTPSIVAHTVSQARPGTIVVLHITQANAPRTADALPQIAQELRARGYQLVSLSSLLS